MGSSWKRKEPDCSQLLEAAIPAHGAPAQGCMPAALTPHTEVCAGIAAGWCPQPPPDPGMEAGLQADVWASSPEMRSAVALQCRGCSALGAERSGVTFPMKSLWKLTEPPDSSIYTEGGQQPCRV